MSKVRDAKRCYLAEEKFPELEDVLPIIRHADPSKHLCVYMDWLCKSYNRGEYNISEIEEVKEVMSIFDKNKVRYQGKDKDINSFTYPSLKEFLGIVNNPTISDVKTGESDRIVMYDGPLGTLYVPLNEKTSCELGSGTKWCTAAESGNMFNHYSKQGPIYIWIDKQWNSDKMKELTGENQLSKKFQFHFETGQFNDELDKNISIALLTYFRLEHPVIKQLFQRYEEELLTKREAKKVYNYLHLIKDFNYHFNEMTDIIMTVPYEAYRYSIDVGKNWKTLRNRPDVDQAILEDPHYNYDHALSIRNITPEQVKQYERYVIKDPYYAALFTRYIRKSEWKEAESIIETDYHAAFIYALFTHKRMRKAEPYIIRNKPYCYRYATEVLHARWYQMEETEQDLNEVSEDDDELQSASDDMIVYALLYVRGRMPKLEEEMAKSRLISYYCNNIVRGRLTEYEHIIANNYPFGYGLDVLKGNWSNFVSKEIANKVYSNVLIGDVQFRYYELYGRDYIYENSLLEDDNLGIKAQDALNYAKEVLKARWIDSAAGQLTMETAIKIEEMINNSKYKMRYMVEFAEEPSTELENMIENGSDMVIYLERFKKHYTTIEMIRLFDKTNRTYKDVVDFSIRVTGKRLALEEHIFKNAAMFPLIEYVSVFQCGNDSTTNRILAEEDEMIVDLRAELVVDYYVTDKNLISKWRMEEYAIKYPLVAAIYAHKALNGRFYKAEDVIYSNDRATMYYAVNVLKYLKRTKEAWYSYNELTAQYLALLPPSE